MKALLLALLAAALATGASAADKKIVLLAGRPSHPAGQHEHRAGMLLLQKCLEGYPGVQAVVASVGTNGWVEDESIFNDAAAVILYSDGAGGHPYLREGNLAKVAAIAAKGVGIGFLHYATEPTKPNGQTEFLAWTGGAFEVNHSVNPIFLGEFKSFPQHAVTRGVRPFSTRDEWYYHIRFREGMQGVTPILSLIAPLSSLNRPDGPVVGARSGNEDVWASVRKGEPQHVMWVTERADGGRGFGFTGGHYHANWANPDQRKLVLNAFLWVAKVEVPAGGVVSTVTPAMLRANLDPKGQQTAVVSSLGGLVSMEAAVVSETRRALIVTALAQPRDAGAIAAKARELADAEYQLAIARASMFADIQASPDKLGRDQVDVLIQAAR